jgi:hypothetical protein
MTNTEIAATLDIADGTVAAHLSTVRGKLISLARSWRRGLRPRSAILADYGPRIIDCQQRVIWRQADERGGRKRTAEQTASAFRIWMFKCSPGRPVQARGQLPQNYRGSFFFEMLLQDKLV